VRAKRRERLRALQGPPSAAPTGAERSFELDIEEAVLAQASDSPDEIEAWAGSAGVMVRMAAADNPLAPHRALMTLAKDEQVEVRRRVALSAVAPVEALVSMVKDRSSRVRLCVALNPRTPTETLVALARDRQEEIRRDLASRDGVPSEVMDVLSRDHQGRIRRAVASSPSASDAMVSALMADGDYLVVADARAAAASRIESRLGVSASNVDAINVLLDDAWWDMTPESPEVTLAKVLSPNV